MRRFIQSVKKLNESVTGNADHDREIESEVQRLVHPANQEGVLDLLSILRSRRSDADGMTEEALFDALEKLYPAGSEGEPSFGDLLKDARTAFMGSLFMTTRDAAGATHYCWIGDENDNPETETRDYPDIDMTTPTAQMAQLQTEITNDMMAKSKQAGEFSLGSLARVAQARGIPSQMALMLAQHFVDHLPKFFVKIDGDGANAMYRYVAPEPKPDHMTLFRDLAARASRRGDIDLPDQGE